MKVIAMIVAASAPVWLVLWFIRHHSKSQANSTHSAEFPIHAGGRLSESAPARSPKVAASVVDGIPTGRSSAVNRSVPALVAKSALPVIAEAEPKPTTSAQPGQQEEPIPANRSYDVRVETEAERRRSTTSSAEIIPSEASEDMDVATCRSSFPAVVFQAARSEEAAVSHFVEKECVHSADADSPLTSDGRQPKSTRTTPVGVGGKDYSGDTQINPPVATTVVEIPIPAETETAGTEVLLGARIDYEHGLGEDAANSEAFAERPVPKYRPIVPRPSKPRGPRVTKAANHDGTPAKELSFDIRVRLMLSRAGIHDIAFLPERSPETDDNEVLVKFERTNLRLVPQEDWYEDLHFQDAGKYLREGIELRGVLADGRRARWLLSRRRLYVLATHPRAVGFVSTNRLMLGRPHVVMCTADILPQIEELLRLSGSAGYVRLGEDDGVPKGWVAIRDVKPSQPVLADLGDNALNAVRPTPDVEIAFEGGVCLRNQDWLIGYPPKIKFYRGTGEFKFFIDGKEAGAVDGSFVAAGYDEPGTHTVYCGGLPLSRTYSIVEPQENWSEWPAYSFERADICGPLVRVKEGATAAVTIPMTNPLLIGAEPGQVFRCSPRNVSRWRGYVPFDAVWALPAQPFTCDKKTSRIIQLGNVPVRTAGVHLRSALRWSSAIMNASRKGLQLENADPKARLLWDEYKKTARTIRRAAR